MEDPTQVLVLGIGVKDIRAQDPIVLHPVDPLVPVGHSVLDFRQPIPLSVQPADVHAQLGSVRLDNRRPERSGDDPRQPGAGPQFEHRFRLKLESPCGDLVRQRDRGRPQHHPIRDARVRLFVQEARLLFEAENGLGVEHRQVAVSHPETAFGKWEIARGRPE